MNRLAVGFSILSTLLAVGCGDSPSVVDAPQMGTASFALDGNDGFTLSAAIEIFSSLDPQKLTDLGGSTTEDDDLATLDVALPVGEYTAEMGEFTLFDGVLPEADVVFDGFSQPTFDIEADTPTLVTMTFQVGTNQTVTFTSAFALGTCAPACGGGALCASIDGGPASCELTCLNSADCLSGETCKAGPGGRICI
jgi:hypothetical protein